MKTRVATGIAALLMLGASGCSEKRPISVPTGAAAYALIQEREGDEEAGAIQPGDHLSVSVLGEADLSSDKYWVDGSGVLQMPLVGDIQAGGRTISQLRQEITQRLGARYIRNPQVALSITEHSKQSVTVEGEVQQAGRFEAAPGLTLLGALALAHSTSKDAKLDEVIVFREVKAQRLVARFDLSDIRTGRALDPQIRAGDRIVVGRSSVKGAWHDLLQTAPLFNIFYLMGARL